MARAEHFGLSVGDPVLIDPVCYDSWIHGLSAENAAFARAREWPAAASTTTGGGAATGGGGAAATTAATAGGVTDGADYAFLVSLLRIPRIMMFLWFIKTGFVVIPGA